MRDSVCLSLINRICIAFEESRNDDTEFAAEVMRVIRAVAMNGRVTILAGGLTAQLLSSELSQDKTLWSIVNIEDDSIPESVH